VAPTTALVEDRPRAADKIESPETCFVHPQKKRVPAAVVLHPHNVGGEVPQPEVELCSVSSIAGPELPCLGKFIRLAWGSVHQRLVTFHMLVCMSDSSVVEI
jgi:hypothetical protein